MKICSKDYLMFSFNAKEPPALYVEQGEMFQVETHDRFFGRREFDTVLSEVGGGRDPLNAITGPIFVEGAKPGLILKVDVLKLELTDDKGVICAVPGKGGFADKIWETRTKVVRIKEGYAYFTDDIKIPIAPHIGRIGTSPPPPEEIPTGTAGRHGGNMDNNMLGEGSTVYLPIFTEGAFLGVGDFHAVMGDGESVLTGVEVAGRATLRCEVVDWPPITWPLLKTRDYVMNMVSAKTLDEATKIALDDMAKLLQRIRGMDYIDAAMLISIAADLRICQIVNPVKTVKVIVPRHILPI